MGVSFDIYLIYVFAPFLGSLHFLVRTSMRVVVPTGEGYPSRLLYQNFGRLNFIPDRQALQLRRLQLRRFYCTRTRRRHTLGRTARAYR